MQRKIFLLSVIALIFLTGQVGYTANSINKDKLLFIKGKGDLFTDFRVKLTSTRIRIMGKMGGSLWRQEAPNTVLMYNNENKVFVEETMENYIQDLNEGYRPIAIEEIEGPVSSLFLGKKAKVYQGFANVRNQGRQNVAEFVCIDNNWLSPIAHHMWCHYLGLNRFDLGLPISVTQKREKMIGVKDNHAQYGNLVKVHVLQCQSITELPASSDSFTLPTSCKRGKDKGALIFSSDGNLKAKDLDDLFRTDLK